MLGYNPNPPCSISPFSINSSIVANNLQVLRDYLNMPITINSGYRSEEHNAKIGGAHKMIKGKRVETSSHCMGRAADIVVKGLCHCSFYLINKFFEGCKKL